MRKEFEQMIIQNCGRIRYIAARYSHNGDTDDIYQEILLQLWRSFGTFDGRSKLETWVYRVALNTACTYIQSAVKQRKIKQSPLHFSVEAIQPAQENCQADVLDQFMRQLSDIDAVLLMTYLDGLSSEESALIVGITANAVRSRIKRIKHEFEAQIIGD